MPTGVKTYVRSAVEWADLGITAGYLRLRHNTPGLIILALHPLFCNPEDLRAGVAHPLDGITVQDIRTVVEDFLENGYRFVSPEDILRGLDPAQHYAMLTFDDSYFRNQYALAILREYRIPAAFFISTDHVMQNKPYWWDVIYRERSRRGGAREQFDAEIQGLKRLTDEQIDAYLDRTFGPAAREVIGDTDRPFTPTELADFSRQPGVFLGNHTANHAILTNCSPAGVRSQLLRAQEAMTAMVGQTPVIVAYPNGNHSAETVRIAAECGFRLGLTTQAHKNQLPVSIGAEGALRLGRFSFRDAHDLRRQCQRIRSDVSLFRSLQMLRNRPVS